MTGSIHGGQFLIGYELLCIPCSPIMFLSQTRPRWFLVKFTEVLIVLVVLATMESICCASNGMLVVATVNPAMDRGLGHRVSVKGGCRRESCDGSWVWAPCSCGWLSVGLRAGKEAGIGWKHGMVEYCLHTGYGCAAEHSPSTLSARQQWHMLTIIRHFRLCTRSSFFSIFRHWYILRIGNSRTYRTWRNGIWNTG